jgi:hypothetical protein
LTTVSDAVGTRTPTQAKNYVYGKKKTITRQKESKEKMPKTSVKAVKAPADHADTMEGKKKKKTKKGKKDAACETPSKIDTPKKLTPSTVVTDSSRIGAASTENTRDSYTETELSRAGSELVVQHASGQDQEEEYRQHQFRLHQQQLQLQLQQQNLERLVQQQQRLIYRQQMQQEELYRQHLRQQEMLQAAQHALQLQQQHQHAHHQCQPCAEQRQNWNQLDRKSCSLMKTSLPMHVFTR